MDLPASLAPWGLSLRIFPSEVALSLGPLLSRLSAAVGPLRHRSVNGEGEVDGFDDLSRTGSYERLLATEWLLAEEAPDEFLRRAASAEHLFLRLARPEPAGARRSVVLFDSGPGQLGAPRIAQLAALVVLARRAEAAGARFGWGLLQRPAGAIEEEVTATSVLRLLRSRTPCEAGEADLAAWNERLSGWPELDDTWIVGSPRWNEVPAARTASPPSLLVIRDVFDPDVRRVAVRVVRRGTAGTEIALDLPADPICARLLRDPYESRVVVPGSLPAAARPVSNLLFSSSGHQLLARAAGGGLVVFPVANSPRPDLPPTVLRFADSPAETIRAAGMARRQLSLLLDVAPLGLQLATTARPAERVRVQGPRPGESPFAPGSGHLQPLLHLRGEIFTLDAEGHFFRLARMDGFDKRELILIRQGVLAATILLGKIVLVVAVPDGTTEFLLVDADGRVGQREVHLSDAREAFFGPSTGRLFGMVAARRDELGWRIFSAGGKTHLRAVSGSRVVGVARFRGTGEPALFLLEPGAREMSLVGRSPRQKVLTASAEIEHVTLCPTAPRLAYSTVSGEVVIAALHSGAVLGRWQAEE